MKKFFSLVLALVMALSLTTVAWGATTVATVNGTEYDDLQEAIKAASPSGTVEIVADVTVDTWVMFSQNKTIGNGKIITLPMDGLTINGNGKTLTVNNVESAGNGGYLFDNAEELNINNLTIKMNCNAGGIDLKSGTIDTVTFEGGNCIFPDDGEITVNNCTFNTAGYVIYYEAARNDLVVTNNTFNVDPASNVMILYGAETFTGNTVNSGRTVNVVSDTATVSGNNFVDTRVKLYNDGQTLSDNSFGEDAYIDIEDDVTDVDVSGNYWGGGAPSATQIPTAIADKVAVGTYYTTATSGALGGLTGVASTPASGASGAYFTEDLTNLSVHPYCDLATYKYALENYVPAVDAAKTFAKVAIWESHKTYGGKAFVMAGVVASADSANVAFVNGSTVTYLNTNVEKWTDKATVVTTVDVDDAAKCGEMFIAGDVAVYKDAKGKLYVEDATGAAYNVNGKLVLLKEAYEGTVTVAGLKTLNPAADTVYTVVHTYDFDAKAVAGNKTAVTKVYCTVCKADFDFVDGTLTDAVKKFGAGNFVEATGVTSYNNGTVYVRTAATFVGGTVVTPSTDKVESAATFDAGIAMYVGMSVLAATGSAVVIGKKKD